MATGKLPRAAAEPILPLIAAFVLPKKWRRAAWEAEWWSGT